MNTVKIEIFYYLAQFKNMIHLHNRLRSSGTLFIS